jgi:uncharacterized NAD(P)/FAD-binding protein YdhS
MLAFKDLKILMPTGDLVRKDIAVIGGGFSGTVVSVQLLRHAPNLSLGVIDKNVRPAVGLAYGTDHAAHLLNVPAGQMSAFASEPDHFLKWAEQDYEFPVDSRSFLPRALYGRYLLALLEETCAAHSLHFDWIRDEALAVRREKAGFLIHTRSGQRVLAQTVVLALGNFPPGNLGIHGLRTDSRCYQRLAWSKEALAGLADNNQVLLIGSGLTSVDITIALRANGFKGRIHILSRHGLVPQCHSPSLPWPGFQDESLPRTIRGLVRLIRNQAAAAAEASGDWRAVMDSLRPLVQEIWQSLPIEERRRFLRHIRTYWEIHRHRVAPDVGQTFFKMIASGQVQVHAGRITSYSEINSDGKNLAQVTFRDRYSASAKALEVDRVVNCSGPETNFRKIDSALLASLFEQGLVRQDPLGLGLDVDRNGALLDCTGTPSRCLFALGPARKGMLWETTAVPELRVQAANLADHLLRAPLAHQSVPQTVGAAVSSEILQR